MKRCCKCKQIKDESQFGKNKGEKDGLQDACKLCRKEYYQLPHINSRHSQAMKAYKASQAGKIVTKRSIDKRRKNNPNWYKATNAVNNAVRDGILPKVTTLRCSRCPNQARDYHHWSYEPEHWLDVEPLCRKCHINIGKVQAQ